MPSIVQSRLAAQAMQLRMFRRHGSRMRVLPGWKRPAIVDVVEWGTLCLVKCVRTYRYFVFPLHQLERKTELL